MEGKHVERKTKKRPIRTHLKKLGFTNRLALYILLFLLLGLAGGFFLAIMSIKYQYMGALACWTVVFTPIGTVASIVIGKVVDKSRDENTSASGDGIKYARAAANNFQQPQQPEGGTDSPAI